MNRNVLKNLVVWVREAEFVVEGGGSSCLKGVGFTVLATHAGCDLDLSDVFAAVVIFVITLPFRFPAKELVCSRARSEDGTGLSFLSLYIKVITEFYETLSTWYYREKVPLYRYVLRNQVVIVIILRS